MTADVGAFNNTLASRSAACRPLIGIIKVTSETNRYYVPGVDIVEWSMAANAAKVCAAKVHAETSDPAPAWLPHAVLVKACAFVKAHRAQAGAKYIAETSWACGWPSPIPGFRPVPGIMPS